MTNSKPNQNQASNSASTAKTGSASTSAASSAPLRDLSSHQKSFVIKTILAFAVVLLLTAGLIAIFAPKFSRLQKPVMAEPVDYRRLQSMIEKSEHEGLKAYRWNNDGSAQVPMSRALEILRVHPDGIPQ